MVGIEPCFHNHISMLKYELIRQIVGVDFSTKLTGVVSHVVKDRLADKLVESLKANKVKTYMLVQYIDDVHVMTSNKLNIITGCVCLWKKDDNEASLSRVDRQGTPWPGL